MLLSMWILADWLRELRPVVEIGRGALEIAAVRLGPPEADAAGVMQPDSAGPVLCVHGGDRMALSGASLQQVFNRILEAFRFYGDWERKSMARIYEGDSLQALVDAAHGVFESPITVFGSAYTLEAASGAYPPGSLGPGWDYLLRERVNAMETMPEVRAILQALRGHSGPMRVWREQAGWWQWICGLYVQGQPAGFVNVRELHRPLEHAAGQLLEIFSGQLERWMQFNQGERPAQGAQRLLRCLLEEGTADLDKLHRYLLLGGWSEAGEKQIYKICLRAFDPYVSEMLRKRLAQTLPGCYVVETDDGAALLTSLDIWRPAALEAAMTPVLQAFDSFAVRGRPSYRLEEISRSYRLCDLAATLCRGGAGEICRGEDYALVYLCSQLRRCVPDVLEHPALAILRDYDRAHGTALLETLHCFLVNERNLVRTARALYIHRNTLVYRVKKIAALTGADLDDADTRKHLLLSCLAWAETAAFSSGQE